LRSQVGGVLYINTSTREVKLTGRDIDFLKDMFAA
jgi:hypothetical protein